MTKKELIKYIENNSGETESWENLNSMKKDELEKIYEYISKVDNMMKTIAEKTGIDHNVIEPEEVEVVKKKVKPIMTDEYVEHKKPTGLSVNEKRALLRSGRTTKRKINKYTRFGEEEVKFGF